MSCQKLLNAELQLNDSLKDYIREYLTLGATINYKDVLDNYLKPCIITTVYELSERNETKTARLLEAPRGTIRKYLKKYKEDLQRELDYDRKYARPSYYEE